MSYESVVLADGPSFLWPLNETTGTTAADATGNGLTGTYNGGFTLDDAAGPVQGSGAVLLDGSSGYISSSASPAPGAGGFTAEFWVNLNGSGQASFPRFLSNYTGSSGFEVLTESGDLTFLFFTTSQQGIGTSTPLAATGWQYVVMTYDGSSLVSSYLNAVSAGTNAATGAYVPGAQGIAAGASPGGGSSVAGLMAWVAFYPAALSPTQILNHYNAAILVPATAALTVTPAFKSTRKDGINPALTVTPGFASTRKAGIGPALTVTPQFAAQVSATGPGYGGGTDRHHHRGSW